MVIENKPRRSHVWITQLSPSRESFTDLADDVELFEQAVSIEWAEVLEGILNCSGSRVATYSARSLASDFLRFVEDLHPTLSPYRTFELCGKRQEAFTRRIETLLNSIGQGTGCEVGVRPGAQPYLNLSLMAVQQLHLSVVNSEDWGEVLMLKIWPGDTVKQARAFFERVNRGAFLNLENQGWQIRPNLHFSHMQKHLVWANTGLRVSEYFDYFATNINEIGKKNFEEMSLADLTMKWEGAGLISAEDTEKLQRMFGETKRSFLNVIPGFNLVSALPMAKVIEFERSHRLEQELLDSLQVPISAWGESIPQWGSV
ncbi:MAG TPA: hypothetical protein PK916_08765 [Bacteroidota bacterium]|nr:hypothetical protein [Bacteroidota bacterium]